MAAEPKWRDGVEGRERTLKPWSAFVFLEPHWIIPSDTQLPYHLSKRVRLQEPPDCTEVPGVVDVLRDQVADKIAESGACHCMVIEYQATETELPWQTQEKEWSAHDIAEQTARFAHLALWLACPTGLTFRTIVLADMSGPQWVTGAINTYSPTFALGGDRHAEHNAASLEVAKKTLMILESVSPRKPIHTAALLATKALSEPTLEFRSLLMWLAMECLFGPTDGREVTFRLAQRVAFFLEEDRQLARETCNLVKKCYKLRSQIVHGFRVANITDDEFRDFSLHSENLVRRSFLTIFSDAAIMATIDGPSRESYLDGLTFK